MTLLERALGRSSTRAERVRRRRSQGSRWTVGRAASAPKARSRKSVRRRYEIALPFEEGLEIQLPRLMHLRVGLRWLSLLLIGVVLWTLRSYWHDPSLHVGQPSVKGLALMSGFQVRSIAGVSGMHVFQLDPAEVVRRLEAYPEISDAEVLVRWPAEVEIRIVERLPQVRWVEGGKSWWLSEGGVAFVPRESLPHALTVKSEQAILDLGADGAAPAISPELLRSAQELSQALGEVSVLSYDQTRGFGWSDGYGRRVYFGEQGDMAFKVRVYEAIAAHLLERGYPATLISVEDISATYYR